MKANSARKVLAEVRAAGLWIDAVSGNEVLRALRAGFPAGNDPPVIMLTSDVFRDNALTTVLEHEVLPNVGSPGMVRELRDAGYRGPIALRVNPGFGHGHVQACDTGGPSSKHGDLARRPGRAAGAGGRGASCPSWRCTPTWAPAPSCASSTPTCASWSTSTPRCCPTSPTCRR